MIYLRKPQLKVTLGTEVFTNSNILAVKIVRNENGFDNATITMNDHQSIYYPDIVTAETAVQIDLKDASEASYTTIFKGIVRFPTLPTDDASEFIRLDCDGAGYGFADTVCAQEYGAQSKNVTLDTIAEIITDATNGIVPKWVNKILGSATASGFSYDTSNVETITGSIPYIIFPYKTNQKSIDDILDAVQAIKGAAAGAHWIVTTDDHLRVKLVDGTQTGWTKYYKNSQALATLTQSPDLLKSEFQKMGPEANYIIYYGAWRRPSNGDSWTELNAASWNATDCTVADDTDAGDYKVNTAAIARTRTHAVNIPQIAYPSTLDWNYDLSSAVFKEHNVPSLNVWLKRDDVSVGGWIDLVDGSTNYFRHDFSTEVPDANRWYHISLPVGDYSNVNAENWDISGAADWSDIQYISFVGGTANGGILWVDGLHFGDASVCRIAKNSTNITAHKLKVKVLTDKIGKDDTLTSGTPGTTDLGLMAKLAYTELLRLQKTSLVGTVTTPMLYDLLPGQWLHIHAKKNKSGSYNVDSDFRVTRITHNLSADSFTSQLEVTDDLTNSHTRPAYDSFNKQMELIRPDVQDRQAASIKAGDIDIRVTPLEEDYPS